MVKRKLTRFAEVETFNHVVQPPFNEVLNKDYQFKGKWSNDFFKNENPIILELGCGKGEYTVGMARQNPNINFLGIDIKGARIWSGAKTAQLENLYNVGFLRTRVDFVNSFFDLDEIQEIWITFPDPQPKKYYKRLTSTRFLDYYKKIIQSNGFIHLKTDNTDLYQYTKRVIVKNKLELITDINDLYNTIIDDPVLSIKTFYEEQFLNEGKLIHYLKFKLKKTKDLEEPENEE